ncbi:hypothetical protein [Burkholderia sp. AW49-1]
MSKKKRCGLSAEQKALLWQRWKDGESLSDIGRSLGKHAASIHAIVRPHGGIMPTARKRPARCRRRRSAGDAARGDGAISDRRRVGAHVTVAMQFGPHAPGRGRKCLSRLGAATGTPDELF